MLTHLFHWWIETNASWPAAGPAPGAPQPPPSGAPGVLPYNPKPKEPAGAESIETIVDNVKWGAGVSLVVGFFMGLLVWAGGRWIDHHRAGRVGSVMMLCALGGGILYGVGYSILDTFAAGG